MRKSVFGRFWARFFSAILHIYFRIRRGTTLGVRAEITTSKKKKNKKKKTKEIRKTDKKKQEAKTKKEKN